MTAINLHRVKTFLPYADQALVSGVNFLTAVLLARFLGIDVFGLFSMGWLLLLFVSGMQQAIVVMPLYTLLPRDKNKRRFIENLGLLQLIFSTLAGAVSFIVCYAYGQWFGDHLTIWEILGMSALVFFYTIQDYMRRYLFSSRSISKVLVLDLIAYGLQPIVILLLYFFELLTLGKTLIFISLLMSISTAIAVLKFYRHGIAPTDFKPFMNRIFTFSKYLIGTSILQWLSGNYFIVTAGAILGPAAVGAIRVAQNLVGVLNVFFTAMENTVPIRASHVMHEKGKEAMKSFVLETFKKGIIPVVIGLGGLAVFRNEIISFFYGEEYLSRSFLLIGFCLLYILVFAGTLQRFVIRTLERNQIIFWGYVVTSSFSLLLANPIVSKFGLLGVIGGLFLSQAITLGIFTISIKRA
jgi:O-antigen/teichoic acid export membrane protein